MGGTSGRMTNAEQLRVIEWIQAGKSEIEINELAMQENPPFVVSHRKYVRYRAGYYSPQRAQDVTELIERVRAQIEAYTQEQIAQEQADQVGVWGYADAQPQPEQETQGLPRERGRSRSDWWRQIMAEHEEEQRRRNSPRSKGHEAFSSF